jgi:endogenous inhibitor of DNA gyrase (YacG/DUF329 family)
MLSDHPVPLASTKKCPHCGQWTTWHQQPDDCCEHCQQVLEPHRVASEQARQALADKPRPNFELIAVNPADPLPLKLAKYVVRGGQLFFAAIIAFVVWLATVIAG